MIGRKRSHRGNLSASLSRSGNFGRSTSCSAESDRDILLLQFLHGGRALRLRTLRVLGFPGGSESTPRVSLCHSARYGRPYFKLQRTLLQAHQLMRKAWLPAPSLIKRVRSTRAQAGFDHSVAASADPMLQNSHVGMTAAFCRVLSIVSLSSTTARERKQKKNARENRRLRNATTCPPAPSDR